MTWSKLRDGNGSDTDLVGIDEVLYCNSRTLACCVGGRFEETLFATAENSSIRRGRRFPIFLSAGYKPAANETNWGCRKAEINGFKVVFLFFSYLEIQ